MIIEKLEAIYIFFFSDNGNMEQGLFGMIMKDNKGSKSKESDANGSEQCIATTSEELASIFSSANFAPPTERRNSSLKDEENVELHIGICYRFAFTCAAA